MFNVNNLPTWGKWIAGILIGLFVTFGIVQFDNILPSSEPIKSVERVEVKFEVRTEEEKPIKDVRVQFTFNNAPDVKYTDSLGFVTINIPARKDIEITLSKEEFQTHRQTLNLEVDEDRTRIIRLYREENSISQVPIDYQFITAQNHFFPLILSLLKPNFDIKIVKKIFSDVLGIDKYPLIYKSEVYENINRFKSESSNNRMLPTELSNTVFLTSKFFGEDFATPSTSKIYESNGSQKIQVQESEQVSTSESDTIFCEYTFAPVLNPFKTEKKNAQYTSFLEQNNTNFTDALSGKEIENINYGYILQFPKLSDIDLLSSLRIAKSCKNNFKDTWIREIIKNNPEHRGILGFSYSYILDKQNYFHGLGCGERMWVIDRYTPSPYIKFINIRNNSDKTIRIDSIKYQSIENNPYKINNAEKRNSLFGNILEKTDNIGVVLNPNNSYFIPLEFGFNIRSFGKNFSNIEHRNIDKNKFNKLDSIFISKPLSETETEMMARGRGDEIQPRPISQIFFSKEFKENSSSLEELDSLIPNRFSIGEIINVNSIMIDGKEIQMDSPNDEPTTITVAASVQFGSCPYLLIYDGENWQELGTVLSDINEKSLQKEEIHSLGKNTLKFKIEERESEISYIDMISILYISPETKEAREVVYPIPELENADENYYLLNQGESLDIDLKNLIPANALDIKLKINGYFETL